MSTAAAVVVGVLDAEVGVEPRPGAPLREVPLAPGCRDTGDHVPAAPGALVREVDRALRDHGACRRHLHGYVPLRGYVGVHVDCRPAVRGKAVCFLDVLAVIQHVRDSRFHVRRARVEQAYVPGETRPGGTFREVPGTGRLGFPRRRARRSRPQTRPVPRAARARGRQR